MAAQGDRIPLCSGLRLAEENGMVAILQATLPGALALGAVIAVLGLAGAIVHRCEAEHG